MPSDRALGAVLLLVSVGYMGAAALISEPEGQYAVIGPRLFPLVIGAGWFVCSLWIAIEAKEVVALPVIDWRVDHDHVVDEERDRETNSDQTF